MSLAIEIAQKALQAAQNKDWEAVSELDAQCRSEVDRMIAQTTETNVESTQQTLVRVQAIYQRVTELAVADRQAIAEQRQNIVKSRNGALSYFEAKVRGDQEG